MPIRVLKGAKALALVAAAAAMLLVVPAHSDEAADIIAGQKIAETYCEACHAIGPDGDSPRVEAPQFRELGKRFPIENLEESLAEGIMTGHPDMPQFEMTPDEIGVFLAYLNSIQVKP